jgi:exonuclease III
MSLCFSYRGTSRNLSDWISFKRLWNRCYTHLYLQLGAKYCRKKLKNGGVCTYIQETLKFSNINLLKHCKVQDIEIAAIQLKLNKKNVIICCVYRAASGNFDYFLNKLDNILNSLHKHKTEFVICGDKNINYLENNNKKKKLLNLLCTYNLIGTAYFPTRIANSCHLDR